MLVAGVFLREFVAEGVQWVRIDIAGPSLQHRRAVGLHPQGQDRGAGADAVRNPGGHRRERQAVEEGDINCANTLAIIDTGNSTA